MYPQSSQFLRVALLNSFGGPSGLSAQLRAGAAHEIQTYDSTEIAKKNCIELTEGGVVLQGGEELPAGLVVRTASVGPIDLNSLVVLKKNKRDGILPNLASCTRTHGADAISVSRRPRARERFSTVSPVWERARGGQGVWVPVELRDAGDAAYWRRALRLDDVELAAR